MTSLTSTGVPVPHVNDLVRVTVGDESGDTLVAVEARSRIEDVVLDPGTGRPVTYLLAAPRFAGDVEAPQPGSPCVLHWLTERGLCTLPVSLAAVETGPAGLRLWRVTVTGEVTRHERRQYVRIPWSLPARLEVRTDLDTLPIVRRQALERAGIPDRLADLPGEYQATAVNVSEGGLLCVSHGPAMPGDLPLVARFTIGEKSFEIPASVVWSTLRSGNALGSEVESAIAFDDPEEHGDALRPLVFAEQLRARRLGRR